MNPKPASRRQNHDLAPRGDDRVVEQKKPKKRTDKQQFERFIATARSLA
jgi:hypothetical protein